MTDAGLHQRARETIRAFWPDIPGFAIRQVWPVMDDVYPDTQQQCHYCGTLAQVTAFYNTVIVEDDNVWARFCKDLDACAYRRAVRDG